MTKRAPECATMVRMRRSRLIALATVTLAVFGLGLTALLSTGGGKGNTHPPVVGSGLATTTNAPRAFGSQVAQTPQVPDLVTVPNVVGLPQERATDALMTIRLTASNVPATPKPPDALVLSQAPVAGSRVERGTYVLLSVAG
jgi:hypothetical protein